MHYQLHIMDGSTSADRVEGVSPVCRQWYEVIRPLFKRGRLWREGEKIELEQGTAGPFVALGDLRALR